MGSRKYVALCCSFLFFQHTSLLSDPCIPQEGIPYRIISRLSNRALDVRGVSKDDGAAIQQWSYAGTDNQKWKFARAGGSYIITSVLSGRAIDVDTRSGNVNGARVQQ